MISSDADTLGKRRLSADPKRERSGGAHLNTDDSLGGGLYQQSSSKGGTASSKASRAGSNNSRFVDQQTNKIYSSLQALPKHTASVDDAMMAAGQHQAQQHKSSVGGGGNLVG